MPPREFESSVGLITFTECSQLLSKITIFLALTLLFTLSGCSYLVLDLYEYPYSFSLIRLKAPHMN
jgi:hypothetical protein